MNTTKTALLLILISLPLFAQAHGEDVLLTLFIYVISAIVFLIGTIFLKLPLKSKGILVISYFIVVFLTMIIVNSMPYNDNMALINFLSIFLPLVVAAFVYHKLKPAA